MEKQFVSVILPTYNRAKTLGVAIQSVINQTYTNWELIIIDDCSVDNTEMIVRSFQDSRIKYIKNDENKGANYSRNRGCSLAKGEYLAFLDSDNEWFCNKLEKQVYALDNAADNVAICSAREIYENSGETIIIPKEDLDSDSIRKSLYYTNVIDTNVALVKRQVFEKVGGFDVDMPRYQDYELFYRIVVIEKYDVIYIKEVLDKNKVQNDSISKDGRKMMLAISRLLDKYYEIIPQNERFTLIGFLDSLLFPDDDSYNQGVEEISQKPIFNEFYAYKYLDIIDCYRKEVRYNALLMKIVEIHQKQKSFLNVDYLSNKKIAIYGCGVWGNMIYRELENNNITVEYGIDISAKKIGERTAVTPNQIDNSIDLVIVSNFQIFSPIKENIKKYFHGEIVSVEEMINKAYDNLGKDH
jgi:glycosyltransferase involved in cell wall biosynthesis